MRKLIATLTVSALITAVAIVSAQQAAKPESKPANASAQHVKATKEQVKKAPGSPMVNSKKGVVSSRLARLERRAARMADRVSRIGTRIERRLERVGNRLSRIPDRVAQRLSRIPKRLERAIDRLT